MKLLKYVQILFNCYLVIQNLFDVTISRASNAHVRLHTQSLVYAVSLLVWHQKFHHNKPYDIVSSLYAVLLYIISNK